MWNGEEGGHIDQYERMANNLLAGRLDFAYGDEDQLLTLENPYDPEERYYSGVVYHWDHAYYDGHYYMYFGVVPVLLAYLPYRVLTGNDLTGYHGTQLFVAAAILGIFALFQLLSRRFFPKLPFATVLALSVAVSLSSVWYSVAEPALYCTAITAGIALEVWSLYFFFRAVWVEQKENRQILLAGIGALLGALVFGCRPTVALANLLVLPMLIAFLKQRRFSLRLLGKLVLAALPYVLVAAGLMLYNYARFDDPFEFGQAYQLTVADQTDYATGLSFGSMIRVLNSCVYNFFYTGEFVKRFPFLSSGGIFFNFPLLLLCLSFARRASRGTLRAERLTGTMVTFPVAAVAVAVMIALWTPYLMERYRMDLYYLLGIACFLSVGIWHRTTDAVGQNRLCAAVSWLSAAAGVSSVLYCFQTVERYHPQIITALDSRLFH